MIPRVLMVALTVLIMGWTAWLINQADSPEALVLYCAHDLDFAQTVIEDFTRETGIPVRVVGDTEANKSLGLVERILRERNQPLADVFWNNQVLGTMRLQDQGLLLPYRGSGFARIPEQFKDPEGHWTGFAARFRVWITNTLALPATVDAIEERMASDDLSRVAIAIPIFGTTLSQYSVLWNEWGEERLKRWHQSLLDRKCRFVTGNATVKNQVAEGACDLGMTDTDDVYVALDDRQPVEMLPILIDDRPLCIPNSVAIIRGTRRQAAAQKLIDYLLSEAVELKLARSAARQVPLGPVPITDLPEEVQRWMPLVPISHDCRRPARAQQACLDWLKSIYVP